MASSSYEPSEQGVTRKVMIFLHIVDADGRQPCWVMPRERVGRVRGEPDEGRGRHDSLARLSAAVATGTAAGARDSILFSDPVAS